MVQEETLGTRLQARNDARASKSALYSRDSQHKARDKPQATLPMGKDV